jgi:hypothetical protein
LAAYWADSGQAQDAAVLLGHLDAHDHRFKPLAPRRTRTEQTIGRGPGVDTWRRIGADLDRDQLVDYALQHLTGKQPGTTA